MRIIVADCSAEYSGRLQASLPQARRVILLKADGSVLIFSEIGSYKPLNWMAAPCTMREVIEDPPSPSASVSASASSSFSFSDSVSSPSDASAQSSPTDSPESGREDAADEAASGEGVRILRVASDKGPDILEIRLFHVYADDDYDLGEDPGLVKDGVEDHLQRLLAAQIERIGSGSRLVRREYPTPIGPVDIMAVDEAGTHVAVEIKRHGGVDGVEQLTRYCRLLDRDPLLAPVRGILAAQTITPQAKVLAESRGLSCLILDYDDMKDEGDADLRLF
ncbi:endonuclease NucS [uncultured Bifidobacterium sp.]|uniref:endonuclease NucS n=1 Tax=uncultured Bifidobacterium sp. TaxID=165187 RepID=UPI0028DB04FF|nr:endonuclease NucS [uncultured Bifidobacterium sp.]